MSPRKFAKTFARRRAGTAALEFAIVVPVLITLLFGVIQFGAVVFVQNNMVNAAREGARRIAAADITPTEAQTLMEGMLASWALSFSYSITMPNPADPNDRDIIVQVTVPAADAAIVSFPPIFTSGNVVAQVTMRQES